MKKINWKKWVLAVCLGVLGVQAAGCGGSDAGNTTAKKEFVYVPEYQKLDAKDGVNGAFINKDTVYYRTGTYNETEQKYEEYLAILKVGEETPRMIPLDFGENSSIWQIGMDRDGNFLAILSTYIYDGEENGGGEDAGSAAEEIMEGETETGEETGESEEGTETGEEAAEGGEGTETGEEAAESEPAEEDGEEAQDDQAETKGNEELSYEIENEGGGSAHAYFVTSSGGTAVISDDDQWSEPSSQIMELCRFSADGNILSRTDISKALGENQDMYVQNLETDKDGNIYISMDQNVAVLDKDGNAICMIGVDNWISGMFSTKDGEVYALYYGNEGMEVHPVDIKAKAMGDAVENMMTGRGGGYMFAPGTESDIVFCVDNNLYTYSFGDEAPVTILNLLDCDIDRDDVDSVAILEDGRIMMLLSSWDNESGMRTVELAFLTKKKGSEVPEQKILTYGTLYLDYSIRKEIIEFNKTNTEYRIEVKEYVTGDSMDSYATGQELMNTDIVSGKGPDIIELSNMNTRMYAAKGILEDLYPYMDADEEINREDYLENVRKAFEVNGKLYAMPSRFYINTVLAKVSNVGERNSITLDELMDIMDGLPENTKLYEYATKSSILSMNVAMNLDRYVNWETGECGFGDEEFIKALEFANRFDAEYKDDTSSMSRPEKLQKNRVLMEQTSISSMEEYIMYEAMFGEPIAFCGYPTSTDNGSFVSNAGCMMGINAKSPNKEGAWQFIRSRLTKDAQEGDSMNGEFGFPVMKSALEEQFERDMTEEYYEDVDGSKKRMEKTTWGYDNFSVRIFAAKDYEVEAVRKLIENTDTMYQYDEEIMGIITEESGAYFEGQKSAKETADIIQNRIQVYVNENR